jgi:hypothetical protein
MCVLELVLAVVDVLALLTVHARVREKRVPAHHLRLRITCRSGRRHHRCARCSRGGRRNSGRCGSGGSGRCRGSRCRSRSGCAGSESGTQAASQGGSRRTGAGRGSGNRVVLRVPLAARQVGARVGEATQVQRVLA